MSFRFLTAGESHGRSLVGIMEGLPSGLKILEKEIHQELKRRKQGYGRGARQKIEDDALEILTGVRHGESMGSPITLVIWNKDFENWGEIMQVAPFKGKVKRQVHVPRPGHADYVGGVKYKHKDLRNVLERASARETAIRVALGSVAKFFLKELGVHIASRVVSIGDVHDSSIVKTPIHQLNEKMDKSPVRCYSKASEKKMIEAIDMARKNGDSLGGVFEVIVSGAPLGLGSYVQWDRRLEGPLAQAFMSLNAIKGVEIGMGFDSAHQSGRKVHDEMAPSQKKVKFKSNKTGGIIGGMSSGEDIIIRAAMKPIATLMKPLNSVDLRSGESVKAHVERSDYCAVPAAGVIGESLAALCLAEAVLEKFGGDSMSEIKKRVKDWRKNY